jgi:hypothetical protein
LPSEPLSGFAGGGSAVPPPLPVEGRCGSPPEGSPSPEPYPYPPELEPVLDPEVPELPELPELELVVCPESACVPASVPCVPPLDAPHVPATAVPDEHD